MFGQVERHGDSLTQSGFHGCLAPCSQFHRALLNLRDLLQRFFEEKKNTMTYHVIVEGVRVSVDHWDRLNHGVVECRQEFPDGGVHSLELPFTVRHLTDHCRQSTPLELKIKSTR